MLSKKHKHTNTTFLMEYENDTAEYTIHVHSMVHYCHPSNPNMVEYSCNLWFLVWMKAIQAFDLHCTTQDVEFDFAFGFRWLLSLERKQMFLPVWRLFFFLLFCFIWNGWQNKLIPIEEKFITKKNRMPKDGC